MEVALFVGAVAVSAVLLFAMVFFVIMFSDLESDFINPIDMCHKLNAFVLPEFMLHWLLASLFLLTLHPVPFLLNAPLAAYHVHRVLNGAHWYDPTEIFRRLPEHKRECFVKLAFYVVTFFYYLYRMIYALIQWN